MSGRIEDPSTLPECCRPVTERKGQGLLWGLFYGLVPHTFCILFIVFSIVGATVATSFVRQVMFVPYLFQLIVALSLVFATLSAIFYLRRNGLLSWAGAQRKWRYLSVMYGTTLAINFLLFWFVFPAVANLDLQPMARRTGIHISIPERDPANRDQVTLRVDPANLESGDAARGHSLPGTRAPDHRGTQERARCTGRPNTRARISFGSVTTRVRPP